MKTEMEGVCGCYGARSLTNDCSIISKEQMNSRADVQRH